MDYFIYIGLLGLCLGSFLNVLIVRVPNAKSIWFPRSHCLNCKRTLRLGDLIPVVSFILLKGHCHFCKSRISFRYPLVEIISCFLSILLVWKFGVSDKLFFGLLFTGSLIALSFIDLEHMILPDLITLPMLWLGLIVNAFHLYQSPEQAILGAALGYLTLWIIYWAFKITTQKEGLGYGDFKLVAMLGAWMGWQSLPLILLISSLTAAIYGVVLIVLKRNTRHTAIPFGPFLASGGFVVFLYGQPLTDLLF